MGIFTPHKNKLGNLEYQVSKNVLILQVAHLEHYSWLRM
jgi:hypothetical protein